jgi:hypothetical protein
MKNPLLFLLLLFGALTAPAFAQNPQPLIAELVAGPLNWQYSVGGFAGMTTTPNDLGITRALEFFQTPAQTGSDTLSYRVYINNQLMPMAGTTRLTYRNTIFGPGWVLQGFPFDGMPPMPPFIDLVVQQGGNGVFDLQEECYDCFSHRYVRSPCWFSAAIMGDLTLCAGDTTVLSLQNYDTYQWYSSFDGQNWLPVQGATGSTLALTDLDILNYFRAEVSIGGCYETTDSVLLDGYVFLMPFIISEGDFTIGPNVLCPTDTLRLILGEPYNTNIQWYNFGQPMPNASNDTLVLTNAPGEYFVTASPDLCPNLSFSPGVTVTVQVVTVPVPTIVPNGPTLSVSNPGLYGSFQWYLDGQELPGATGPTWTATASGLYSVSGVDLSGCASFPSAPVQVTVSSIDGVPADGPSLRVWPNPATANTLRLEWPAGQALESLELYSADGRTVRRFTPAPAQALDLDLSGLPSGVYLVRAWGTAAGTYGATFVKP